MINNCKKDQNKPAEEENDEHEPHQAEEHETLLDAKSFKNKKSPWDESSLISKYFLAFFIPLIRLARTRLLRPSDIPPPPEVDKSRLLAEKLQRNYDSQFGRHAEPSFTRAMFKTFAPQVARVGILDLINKCIISPLQMIALGWLIRDSSNYSNSIASLTETPATFPFNNATVALNETLGPVTTIASLTTSGLNATISQLAAPIADQAELERRSQMLYYSVITNTIILLACSWLSTLITNPYFLLTNRIAMQCRIAASSLIYRKALRLSQVGLAQSGRGQITNLLSNDVNRFEESIQETANLVSCPLQAIILLFVLARYYIGVWSTLLTLVSVLILLIIQTFMGRAIGKFRNRIAARTDERVKLLGDIIVGIRIIKMYAWEQPFKKLASEARDRELNAIGRASVLKSLNMTLFFSSSKLLVFISLVTYISLGFKLNPEVTFVTIGVSNLLRLTLTFFFPSAISHWIETLVSCARINRFLKLKDKRQSRAYYKREPNAPDLGTIEYERVCARWGACDTDADVLEENESTGNGCYEVVDCVLRNVDLLVKPGELILLVGRVGSGKSSLLLSILGELPVARGRVRVAGKLSYAPQEPWVFPGSVRDNILFGSKYSEQRYNSVINCCCLRRDLDILPKSDRTLVGERGVSLSGGQKARVNLARALYQEADVYLLDDPLSAVDAPVARDIFREAIQTFLHGKTIILATHQLQFIDRANRLLIMRNEPKTALFGAWRDVEPNLDDDDLLLSTYMKKSTVEEEALDEQQEIDRLEKSDIEIKNCEEKLAQSKLLGKELTGAIRIDLGSQSKKGGERVSAIAADLQSYIYYRKEATNWLGVIWFVLIALITLAFTLYNDIFLTQWTDSEQRKDAGGADFKVESFIDTFVKASLIGFYAAILLLVFTTGFVRSGTLYWYTLTASRNMHSKFLDSIMSTRVRFFDFTPIGLLLNRVSRDVGYIDEILPQTLGTVITILLNVVGSIGLAIIIQPINVVPTAVLLLLALLMRSYVSKAIIRTKQIEGANRTPIFSHLSISLDGLATIRALEVERKFVLDFDTYQDSHSGAWFCYLCSGRILSFAIDLMMLLMVTSIIVTQVIINIDTANAATIGLLITQIIWLPGPVQWGMRQLVELESQMTSVQRIKEYSFLESEPDVGRGAGKPEDNLQIFNMIQHSNNPPNITFEHLCLSYFVDEQPVLKDLSFTIRAGEKVGVVGRTGAGKSSIIAALFRLYPYEGAIKLDDLDTNRLSLRQLRSSISIIPQDPVLFCGDLRRNLDPFNEHLDADLWSALEAVQLKSFFESTNNTQSSTLPQTAPIGSRNGNGGLEFAIQSSGSNLSVGQRQLICLARAILRRNKVLVLDEATANVDPETDSYIQQTIRKQFKHCTVITIAHRLLTIVDSDRVLVLEAGRVKEFDTPLKLSRKSDGIFSSMLDSNQSRQAARLRHLIEEAAKKTDSQ